LETLATAICQEKFTTRLAYAMKILFKRKNMKFILVNQDENEA
jgi:hypothetical protein